MLKITYFSVGNGLMFCKGEKTNIDKTDAQNVSGDDLFFDLKDIEPETFLYKTLFGFFERCHKINEVLSKHGFFVRFFEQRNMYRFPIKKNVQGKNKVIRNLSSCVLRKFSGYETIRNDLARKEYRSIDSL